TNADVRMPMQRSQIAALAQAIAAELRINGAVAAKDDVIAKRAARIAGDRKHAGAAGVVMAGPAQSAEIHSLVAAINSTLQSPVRYVQVDQATEIPPTATTLIILGGNPRFDGSADVVKLIESAKTTVHLSHDVNDT